MVAQQLGIPQELLQVMTHLLNAFRAWFTLEAAAGVNDEILQSIGFFQSFSWHAHQSPPPLTASVSHHSPLTLAQQSKVKGLGFRCAIAQRLRDLPRDLDDLSPQLLQHLRGQPMRGA